MDTMHSRSVNVDAPGMRGDAVVGQMGPEHGPNVVMIHGCPGRPQDFRHLAAAMPHARVTAVAMPGFSQTPQATSPDCTLPGRARFVSAVLDALGIDTFAVVGHSFGAGIAGTLAALEPARVPRVALLAPISLAPHQALRYTAPKLTSALLNTRGVRRIATPVMKKAFMAVGFPRGITAENLRVAMQCAADVDFAQLGRDYRAIRAPTAVAYALDDRIVEHSKPAALAKVVPDGPRLVFDTGDHGIIKSQARPIADALGTWLTAF